jgi:hypothetical protein
MILDPVEVLYGLNGEEAHYRKGYLIGSQYDNTLNLMWYRTLSGALLRLQGYRKFSRVSRVSLPTCLSTPKKKFIYHNHGTLN